MTLNRKALRAALKSALVTDLGASVAAVYDFLPKSLLGQSPVITIESGPSSVTTTPDEPSWVGVNVGLWIDRTDAEAAEDQLDDFTDLFIAAINRSFNVEWTKPTEPSYEVDDGKLYRIEWHELSIEWW